MPASPSDSAGPGPVYDLAVVGAGPAGLAAAVAAAGLGLRTALVDAGPRPGGQYYRHPAPELGAARPEALHHHWAVFARLTRRLDAHRSAGMADHLTEHQVWTVEPPRDAPAAHPWTVHATVGPDQAGRATVHARALLLATGGYERQLPFPGWTLPGVVTAGGAQAMLKSGLVLPGRRVVVAGSGPLLLAAAASLAAAGARVPAVVEAAGYLRYARRPAAPAADAGKLAEAAVHAAALLRHRVRLITRSAVVAAHGTDRVTGVTIAALDRDWRPVPGTERRLACDALAVGHGLLPQLDLAVELGCATRTTPDGSAALRTDAFGRTSLPRLWGAGEIAGIAGAAAALAEGELAALSVAAELRDAPRPARSPRARLLLRRRARSRAFAEVMSTAHRPGPGWPAWLRDDTEVCRCEEVTAGHIREAVDELGARDVRSVKLLTRAGMGWCQGRMCGTAVACLAAGGGAPAAGPASRPLAGPVPLGTLAATDPLPPS